MATRAIPDSDLFPTQEVCPQCEQLACDCPKPDGLLGALAAQPQPDQGGAGEGGPPDMLALIAQIYASGSVGAFLSVRVEQALKHGHAPALDLQLPPFQLPREAHRRLVALLEDVGRDQGGPARSADHFARRKQALRRLDVAGALMMAARDNLAALIEQGVRHG